MQDVDNNMDDLFRKASENYPLKAQPDWDRISKELEVKDVAPPLQKNNRNSTKKLLWLLLLLPFSWICTQYIYMSRGDGNAFSKKESTNIKSEKSLNKQQQNVNNRTRNSGSVILQNETAPKPSFNNSNQDEAIYAIKKNEEKFKLQSLIKRSPFAETMVTNKEISQPIITTGQDKQSNEQEIKDQTLYEKKASPSSSVEQQKTTAQPNAMNAPLSNTDTSVIDNTAIARGSDIIKKQSSKKQGYFYAGLLTGPDISTVKFQSLQKTGYSIGVIAGYTFNKHLTVETGLLWDKKNYYSEGKYFDKTRTDIPEHANIKSIEGYCNMFEIPVNVQYAFAAKNAHNFFVSAGISSYLMKKEKYDYWADYYGDEYEGVKSYRNSGNNIFSVMHISGGYQIKVKTVGNIRIEPYFKIPLKGLGIGGLPISSTGIYFGITRPIR